MSGQIEYAFTIFGMIVTALIILAALGYILFLAFVWAVVHWPRLHLGAPKLEIELHTLDRSYIVTTKSGGRRTDGPPPRIVQQLSLKWWVGLSSRNRAAWFIGFMRWEKATLPRPEAAE